MKTTGLNNNTQYVTNKINIKLYRNFVKTLKDIPFHYFRLAGNTPQNDCQLSIIFSEMWYS